jgi:ZIP family zinc transporter
VFLSNIPKRWPRRWACGTGYSTARIAGIWVAVVAMSVAAADRLRPARWRLAQHGAFIQAFAAGSILTMLANMMMPQAFTNGGREVGLVTVCSSSLAPCGDRLAGERTRTIFSRTPTKERPAP